MATTIQVRFAPNPPAEQVTSYQVHESINGGAFSLKTTIPASTTPLGIDVLNPAPGVYGYKVVPQNLAGNGPESDPASSPGLPSKAATPTVTVVVT